MIPGYAIKGVLRTEERGEIKHPGGEVGAVRGHSGEGTEPQAKKCQPPPEAAREAEKQTLPGASGWRTADPLISHVRFPEAGENKLVPV